MMQVYLEPYWNHYDAESHIQTMIQVGLVDIAFVYPTYGLWLWAIDGVLPKVVGAFMQAYNTWLFEEFCSFDPERLKGVGAVNPHQSEAIVSELHQIVKCGGKAIFFYSNPVKVGY